MDQNPNGAKWLLFLKGELITLSKVSYCNCFTSANQKVTFLKIRLHWVSLDSFVITVVGLSTPDMKGFQALWCGTLGL